MSTNAAAIIAAILAFAATISTAYLAHKGNTEVKVDPRVLEFLQKSVIQLEESQQRLRDRLTAAENETDAQRTNNRKLMEEVLKQQDLLRRIRLALQASGVNIPPSIEEMFNHPSSPLGP